MAWEYKLNILAGNILSCLKDGLMVFIYNRVNILKNEGLLTQHHNFLSKHDLLKLLQSGSLAKD